MSDPIGPDGKYDPNLYNFFGFHPSLAAGIVFVTCFGFFTLLNTFLGIKSRVWWTLPTTALGAGGEVAGWAGRLAGHFNVYGLGAYLDQQICLAISPTFFSATCYVVFGEIVKMVDPSISILKPMRYWVYFVIVDIVCLILQGTGGGMSGSAASTGEGQLSLGSHIYLAGVCFQLFNMLLFSALVAHYFWRLTWIPDWRNQYPIMQTREMKNILIGLIGADVMIVLRNFYRSVELGEGFGGKLATHEAYFNCLDATPMVICLIFLTVSHPIFTFKKLWAREDLVYSPDGVAKGASPEKELV